jgi:hypothetical protein
MGLDTIFITHHWCSILTAIICVKGSMSTILDINVAKVLGIAMSDFCEGKRKPIT